MMIVNLLAIIGSNSIGHSKLLPLKYFIYVKHDSYFCTVPGATGESIQTLRWEIPSNSDLKRPVDVDTTITLHSLYFWRWTVLVILLYLNISEITKYIMRMLLTRSVCIVRSVRMWGNCEVLQSVNLRSIEDRICCLVEIRIELIFSPTMSPRLHFAWSPNSNLNLSTIIVQIR